MNRGEGTLGQLATDKQLYVNMTKLLSELSVLTADLQGNQEHRAGQPKQGYAGPVGQ